MSKGRMGNCDNRTDGGRAKEVRTWNCFELCGAVVEEGKGRV
jgi:hypothetical protein